MTLHPKNTPARIYNVNQALAVTAHRGSAAGPQAAGPALARICLAALEEDAGRTDVRTVVLGIMKNMRAAMAFLRDELDGIDSVGKYK